MWAFGLGLVQWFHESSDRQVDCFLMPKHGSKKLIENTHKADKTSIIRTTDLESRIPLFLLGHFQS